MNELKQSKVQTRVMAGEILQLSKKELARAEMHAARLRESIANQQESLEFADISVQEQISKVGELQRKYDRMWS